MKTPLFFSHGDEYLTASASQRRWRRGLWFIPPRPVRRGERAVVMAIENRGMVLQLHAHVGDMLERTGKIWDATQDLHPRRGDRVLQRGAFPRYDGSRCTQHRVLSLHHRNLCAAQRAWQSARIYRKLAAIGSGQSIKALRAVETLLQDIVREALK